MAGPIASLNAALRWDLADFDRGTRHIEGAFGRLRTLGADLAASFHQFGQRMTLGITAPMVALAGFTVNAASNLQELQSAFDYTFGNTSALMNRWAEDTGNAMGRATSEMKAGALAMGQLFKQAAPTEAAAARLSQRFAELAQDAASLYNTSYDEALGKIRSGLSGESEPLRDFGVFLTEAAVKAKALELGMIKVGEELSEQGKIMARSVLITEGLRDATGDVERTSGSFANRVRALKANIQELAEEIGERFLPYAEKIVGWAQGAVEWIGNLPPAVKDAAIGFGIFAAALGPAMLVLGAIAATVLPLFLANMGPVYVAISAIINPLGTAVVILGKLAGEFGLVGRALAGLTRIAAGFLTPWGLALTAVLLFKDDIIEAFQNITKYAQDALGPRLTGLLDQVRGLFADLGQALRDFAAGDLGQAFSSLFETIGDLIRILLELGGVAVITAIGALFDIVSGIAEYVRGVVQTVSRLLQGDWEGAWQAAGNTVARAVQRIANLIRGVMPWLAGALDLMARLTGDGSPLPSAGKGQGGGWSGSAIGFMAGAAAKATEAVESTGTSYAMPGSGGSGGRKGGGGRSGPSAAELADRREEMKLDQALAIAREKNDIEAERSLRRQIDLRSKIEHYTRAGLDAAAAKVAAEKDMTELDQARAEAMARAIATEERSIDIQLAELRNDYEGLRFLKDEEFLERQILMWREKGLSIAEAERQSAMDLKNLEQARADQISRRLADQEDARQIELARLRGDDPARLNALEERRRIRDRADELRSQGVNIEDAQAQAMQEGADRSRAALTGTFRDTFRSGLQAAMNGDLGGFFKNWIETRAFDALAKVLDRLADQLANLVAGGTKGGGLFGSILGLAGAVGGLGAGTASVKSAGSAVGNAAARAVKATSSLPRFNTGGWGTIKGAAGIDTNVLSLNDNPIAMVSSGELLNVQRAGDGAARAVQSAVRVVLEDTTGLFKTRVETISGDVSSGQISAARPAIAADGAAAAIQRIRRIQDRGLG
ncbi:MAG: phage tail tape measure protein [Blastomonas fulva]|uniref:phage tail tape measure protein n=1 Tax=Blastomonas fulva TaxID=1550728 RepID=UPI0024E1AD76|nr:phage tail tape measure protein [Blastomonas fulva]MDK2758652.1 phage tail tape measure protein [Blastomonas fulva]